MAKLIIKDSKGETSEHELVDDVTTMGRSSANIIQVKDSEASRQHCKIEKDGENFRLIDLGSRNGTKLNGTKVSTQTMKAGDTITIGKFALTFDAPLTVSADELGATVEVTTIDEKEVRPVAGAGPKYVVEMTEGPQAGKTIDVGTETITLGRNSSNTIQLSDEAASNYHAEITKEPIGYVIVDLGSTNGTFVNGEKIVKTPLSSGKEIRIGQTKMVFKNIGAPADDEVFGTVVLDTDMLEQELAASEKLAGAGGLVRAVLGLLGLLLGVGLVIGLVMVIGRLWGSGSNGIPGNRLRNYSFDAGIDPDGSPERWKIMSRQPFRWEVDKTADRVDAKEQAGALVIHRGGGGDPLATQVSCEYLEEMQINPSRGYELSGYVRSEGAPSGIYGLKVTWAGGRGGAESHYITVAGGRAEWEPVRRVFAPPAWATHSRVACFSIGNQGKVYYDDVGFVEVERPPATVQVRQSFSKICADFDSRGIAFIKSFDRDAASDVALEIVGPGQGAITSQELAQSVSVESSARSATFSGEIYEFYNMKLVNYDLRVTPGKDGLVLHYGLACPGGLTLKTVKLRMTVETGFGAADPLLYDDSGKAIPRTSGTIRNVSEILFEVPGQDEAPDKFAIFFPARAQTAKITPRGDRKEIEIILAKDLRLSKVDTSFLVEVNFSGRFERLGVEKSLKELEGLVQEKDYPGAYQKITSVQGTYSKKFPDEVEKALGTSRQLDALADAAVKTAETRLNLLKIAETEEARVTASADLTKYLSEQKGLWQGTKHETRFAAIEVSQKNLLATRGQQLRRAEAQRLKEKADSLYDKGLYSMAKSFYSTIVSKYADTAVAEQVRTGKIIEICTSRVELNATERKLVGEALNGIKNLELNKMFKRALQKLRESDAMMRFPDNETLKAKEKELRGKIDQGG